MSNQNPSYRKEKNSQDIDDLILNHHKHVSISKSPAITEDVIPTLRSVNAKTLKYSLSSICFLKKGFTSPPINISFEAEYKRIYNLPTCIIMNDFTSYTKNLLNNYTSPDHFSPSQRSSIDLLITRGSQAYQRHFWQKYKFKYNMEEKLKRLRNITDKYGKFSTCNETQPL